MKPDIVNHMDINIKIRKLYDEGYSAKEIGSQLGIHANTVLNRLRSVGGEPRTRGGARRHGSTIHQMLVEDPSIQATLDDPKLTQRAKALALKVHPSTLRAYFKEVDDAQKRS